MSLQETDSVQNENDSFPLACVLFYSSSLSGVEVKLNYIKTEDVKAKVEKLKLRVYIY